MRRKLLLADDSITMQRLVSLTFADEAIDVIATGDGDSVLKKVQELRPDIVLVDVFLPGKNGYEICEHIKSSPQLKSIPVILLVGTFEPLDEAEAQRVKADGHLMKPFESSVLVNLVKDLVGLAPAGEAKSEEQKRIGLSAVPGAKSERRGAKQDRPFGPSESEEGEVEHEFEPGRAQTEVVPKSEPAVEESPRMATSAAQTAVPRHDALPKFEPQAAGGLLELELDFSSTFNDSTRGSFIDSPILDIYSDTTLQILRGEIPLPARDPKAPRAEAVAPALEEVHVEAPVESARAPGTAHVQEPPSAAAAAPSSVASASPAVVGEVSEEIINVIVQRVLEKMSDAVVREIAWEVVPELSEQIIKAELSKKKPKK
jgi:CheY-like chemotaxis protein